jgi:2-keto-4-pentenoate hydratase
VFGYLTSATVLAPGSEYSAGRIGELRAETELAVEIGDDGGIAGVAVALELNDVTRPPFDAESIVAHNVFHRAVAFSLTRPHVTLDGLEARLLENGTLRAAAPLQVAPERSIATLAELLEDHGQRLEPGDRVITGGLTHVPVGRGNSVRAEIDGLGQVVLEIA